jgi:hypothetical protein
MEVVHISLQITVPTPAHIYIYTIYIEYKYFMIKSVT